jgi:hypothetical protein
LVNIDELDAVLYEAERRVLEIQTKLHRWASDEAHRRFDDLYNLVTDPSFLLVAWDRVRHNKGARTAGVDGETAYYIESMRGVDEFLTELRDDLRARTFHPLPSRRRAIPKASGKVRHLGIATIRDRVVQASLKLVLEPIFEADFLPCSYGFRPNRRAHDAVAEIPSRHRTRPGSWEDGLPRRSRPLVCARRARTVRTKVAQADSCSRPRRSVPRSRGPGTPSPISGGATVGHPRLPLMAPVACRR